MEFMQTIMCHTQDNSHAALQGVVPAVVLLLARTCEGEGHGARAQSHWSLKATLTLRAPMPSSTRKRLKRNWNRSWQLVVVSWRMDVLKVHIIQIVLNYSSIFRQLLMPMHDRIDSLWIPISIASLKMFFCKFCSGALSKNNNKKGKGKTFKFCSEQSEKWFQVKVVFSVCVLLFTVLQQNLLLILIWNLFVQLCYWSLAASVQWISSKINTKLSSN